VQAKRSLQKRETYSFDAILVHDHELGAVELAVPLDAIVQLLAAEAQAQAKVRRKLDVDANEQTFA
jgi:hypothetical protein